MAKEGHTYGGDWTADKIRRVAGYLRAYTTILSKRKGLRFAYIDAFAGTGYRTRRSTSKDDVSLLPGFQDDETQEFLKGSARVALEVEPRFYTYIFIEKDRRRFAELEKLREEFPERKRDIHLLNEEANHYLRRLCRKDWKARRAVLFLDPYGMQVEWETLEAIAGTRAIDTWLLFPWGVAVNRLLRKDGKIDEAVRTRLDQMFGTEDWFEAFYEKKKQDTLFGPRTKLRKKIDLEGIQRYFVKRLETIFAAVAQNPLAFENSRRCPLYLLCFAVGNPRAAETAIKIAQHILEQKRSNG